MNYQNNVIEIVNKNYKAFEIGIGWGLFSLPLINQGYIINGLEPNLNFIKLFCKIIKILMWGVWVNDYLFDEYYDIIFSDSGPIF